MTARDYRHEELGFSFDKLLLRGFFVTLGLLSFMSFVLGESIGKELNTFIRSVEWCKIA